MNVSMLPAMPACAFATIYQVFKSLTKLGPSCSRSTCRRRLPPPPSSASSSWTQLEPLPPPSLSVVHHGPGSPLAAGHSCMRGGGRPSHGAPWDDLVACRQGRIGRHGRAYRRRLLARGAQDGAHRHSWQRPRTCCSPRHPPLCCLTNLHLPVSSLSPSSSPP
jgi:hypothetical protein